MVDTILFSPGLLGIEIIGANAWSYSHIHEQYKETRNDEKIEIDI